MRVWAEPNGRPAVRDIVGENDSITALPRRRRSRWFFYGLVVVATFLLVTFLALPVILKSAINGRLEKIPDYTGWVDQVSVSLWRGAYTLHGPVVLKRNGKVQEPFFRADEIDFSIAWRELFRGKFVSDIVLQKPQLTFVAAKSAEAGQVEVDRRWQDAINDIFPIDITYLKIADGQVRYINQGLNPKVDVRIAHLDALATGLRNRSVAGEEEFPAKINARGETIGGGHLTLLTQAEPLAEQPHFLLKLELEGVSLPALNDFLKAYAGVDVSAGTFNGYVEVVARNGKFNGYFKPFFAKVDFSTPPGETRPLGQKIWETLVRGFAWIFKNHARDEVATKIPFSGEISNLQVGGWAAFKNMFRHAFIEPLLKKLDSRAEAGGLEGKAREDKQAGDASAADKVLTDKRSAEKAAEKPKS